jgi:tripartite-type tricarboxylate transporter receptor subunit TctC
MNRILVFDTTHHAMWAEEIAREQGVAVEVIPAPEGVDAKCGMALEVIAEALDNFKEMLNKEGIPYTLYQ